jgi:hypothetical protein
MALYIAVTFSNPHSVAGVPDRVMFIADAHGCYSVKAGYQMLRKGKPGSANVSTPIWHMIWKMSLQVPVCAVCGNEQDSYSVMHTFFRCQFARAVWLDCPLGLFSANSPTDFCHAYTLLKQLSSN